MYYYYYVLLFLFSLSFIFFFSSWSAPQMEAGCICFSSHHTPNYEYYFSYDFLCACAKERVEIKDKTNKDSKPKAYVWASNTQNKTGAVKQMTPLKCKIFHRFWQLWNATLSTFHLLIIQRNFSFLFFFLQLAKRQSIPWLHCWPCAWNSSHNYVNK